MTVRWVEPYVAETVVAEVTVVGLPYDSRHPVVNGRALEPAEYTVSIGTPWLKKDKPGTTYTFLTPLKASDTLNFTDGRSGR